MTAHTHSPPGDHHAPVHTDPGVLDANRRLGIASIVFLIIAASAPLTVAAGGAPSAYAVSGMMGAPTGYLVLGVILVFFTVGYAAMSRKITNSGAFYAYISAGLGKRQGIAASWLAFVSYNAMQIGLYGLFGFTFSSILHQWTGLFIPWWVTALIGAFVVGLLGVSAIDLAVKVVSVLVVLEFITVIGFNILAFAHAPEGISAAPYAPENFFGVGTGTLLAFGIAAFMGFESGTIYSEEAREPERTVPIATYTAVLIIALFYSFAAWALAQGTGSSQIVARSQEAGPDLMFNMLRDFGYAVAADIANVLFLTSLFAALIAFHNTVARYAMSLGREAVIPRFLARTSDKQAPVAGSLAQSALAVFMIIVFAIFGMNSPLGELYPVLTLFTWLTNAGAFGLVFLLVVTSVAVIGYFRGRSEEHSAWVRLIAPAIAALGLIYVFVMIMLNFDVMIGEEGPTTLVFVMPGIILLSGVAGFARGEYLRVKRPRVFDNIGSGNPAPFDD
ncbi:MAG: APC family permease [Actinomycetaceae bacterium]|nr:APC family permease [Actinomycetaceae bacterium]